MSSVKPETIDSLRAERDAWRRGAMLVLDELVGYETEKAPHLRVRSLRTRLNQIEEKIAQDLYEAADFYSDSTTDKKDNEEVRATIRAFLSWFEDGWNHQPTEEELAAHYKSIAEPYGGRL